MGVCFQKKPAVLLPFFPIPLTCSSLSLREGLFPFFFPLAILLRWSFDRCHAQGMIKIKRASQKRKRERAMEREKNVKSTYYLQLTNQFFATHASACGYYFLSHETFYCPLYSAIEDRMSTQINKQIEERQRGKEGAAMPMDISVVNNGNKSDEEIVTSDALVFPIASPIESSLFIIDYRPRYLLG